MARRGGQFGHADQQGRRDSGRGDAGGAAVARSEHTWYSGHAWLAGAWTGELIFLMVMAAYVAGLLALTARRPPFSPVGLAIGTGAGVAAGLLMFALAPTGRWPHITVGWLA